MRDHLVEFSGQIADIEEIRQIERRVDADGVVHIVNEWRVRQQVPAVVRSILKTGELGWVDRNTWDAEAFTLRLGNRASVPHRIHRMLGQDDVCRGDGGSRNARQL